jgi:hypothetical protein
MQDENYDLLACIDAKKSSVSKPASFIKSMDIFKRATNTTTNKN